MNAWIQKHDLSADEFQVSDAADAIKRLREFDWRPECELQQNSSGEVCDPGLGLVVGDGHILHICPRSQESCTVHFHFLETKKFLFFFSKPRQDLKTWRSASIEQAERTIEYLFRGDYDAIKSQA